MVPNWPIFKALSPLRGGKIAQHGLKKRPHSTCLCSPNSPKVSLEKHIFDPFLTDFWFQNNPLSTHFLTVEGPKWLSMGSKGAHFTCLGTPNGLGSFLEKHIFDPFFGPKHGWAVSSLLDATPPPPIEVGRRPLWGGRLAAEEGFSRGLASRGELLGRGGGARGEG